MKRRQVRRAIECGIFLGVAWFILILIALMVTPSESQGAGAVSPATRAACTDSYLNHCSHTTPGTPQCKACFRSNWGKLDPHCQAAIRVDPAYSSSFKRRR